MLQEEVMNALFTRTSVRAYQNDALKPEEIRRILQAGFCAPSARNARPWYFIVIQEKEKLAQLSRFSPYASFLKEAAMGILVCGDRSRNPSLDYCEQDCAAATQNMMIEANDLGIGSCWLGGYPNEERVLFLKKALQVEEPLIPLWMIAFGHPKEQPSVKDKWEEDRIRFV